MAEISLVWHPINKKEEENKDNTLDIFQQMKNSRIVFDIYQISPKTTQKVPL